MKYKDFRNYNIKRTCNKKFKDYKKYKKYLAEDFKHRCAYCNTLDSIAKPMHFAVDHFVPREVFKGKNDSLDTDYNNLMYACEKCNLAKSSKYERRYRKSKVKQ